MSTSSTILPVISVVIPCFNRQTLIGAAIESALNQSYAAKEVIVIDDGSTDSSWNAIETYLPYIIAIRTENKGVSAARNTGIIKATGDYIVFLDSDDILEPFALEAYVSVLKDDERTIILGKCRTIGGDGSDIDSERYELKGRVDGVYLDDAQVLSQLASNWGCIIPKNLILKVGGYDENLSLGEDYDLNVRMVENGAMYLPINVCTYNVRLHEGFRLSSHIDQKAYRRLVFVFENSWRKNCDVFNMPKNKYWKFLLANWIWSTGRNLYRHGEKDIGDLFTGLANAIAGTRSWNAPVVIRLLYYFMHPYAVEVIVEKVKMLVKTRSLLVTFS